MTKKNPTDNFKCIGWVGDGYQVNSSGQGNCKVGVFVCEEDAIDFAEYRNDMLHRYNTTDTKKYKHNEWRKKK